MSMNDQKLILQVGLRWIKIGRQKRPAFCATLSDPLAPLSDQSLLLAVGLHSDDADGSGG